jgi:MFS transporter, FHS family, glucose/mannose:H+ symporter
VIHYRAKLASHYYEATVISLMLKVPNAGTSFFRMASPQAEFSQSSSNRKLVLAGQIAFLPTGILTTLLGPMLLILIARWALNDTQAGNLFLVQFLASLVGVQLSGVLLARWGFRPAFLLGLLLMAVGVATLYMGSLWLGLASVAAYGLGLGLIIPADNLLIAEISSGSGLGSRAGAVSLLNFFWGVGAVLCSLMVAWTAAHGLLPFFLGAVALFLILLALAVRNLPFPAAAKSSESSASISWREMAKSPTIWLFAAVFFLYPGAETAVGGWIGSYVSRLGSRGAAMASMMPAFFWSALTVGRALGTTFLRHFSERRVLRAGCAAGAAGIGLMLWAPALSGVIGGALITGLSFATLYPITVARLSQRFGVAARSIGAVMFSLASVGPAIIPWMVGVISHATGSLRAGLLLPLGATVILFLIHLVEW